MSEHERGPWDDFKGLVHALGKKGVNSFIVGATKAIEAGNADGSTFSTTVEDDMPTIGMAVRPGELEFKIEGGPTHYLPLTEVQIALALLPDNE